MNAEQQHPTSSGPTDTSQHGVLTMGQAGTPSLCRHCVHERCVQRRREMAIACVVCESKILPGQTYRILCRINGEVVTQAHASCERRTAQR